MITREIFDDIEKDLTYNFGIVTLFREDGVEVPVRQFVRWTDGYVVMEVHPDKRFKPREFLFCSFEKIRAIQVLNEPTLNNKTSVGGPPPPATMQRPVQAPLGRPGFRPGVGAGLPPGPIPSRPMPSRFTPPTVPGKP